MLTKVVQEREILAAKKQVDAQARVEQRKMEVEERKSQKQPKSDSRKVTRANYDKIQEGMTLLEVEELLGPGKEAASAGNLKIITWQSGIIGLKLISITFEDNRVAAKSNLD